MNKKQIRKIRKNFNNLSWCEATYQELKEESIRNSRFCKFECNSFFVGEKVAEHNLIIYKKDEQSLNKKLDNIRKRIDLLKVSQITGEQLKRILTVIETKDQCSNNDCPMCTLFVDNQCLLVTCQGVDSKEMVRRIIAGKTKVVKASSDV